MMPGAPLGVLIGIVTGLVFALFLGAASKADSVGAVLKVSPQLLAIPTFWFGGPWVATSIFKVAQLDQLLNAYVVFLAITFTVSVGWPAIRLIILIGNRLGPPDA